MKKYLKLKLLFIVILFIIFIKGNNCYAAMQIIPDATTHPTLYFNGAFSYCYNLRSSGTTLGNNTLDPHMSLNSDWGAVLYLGMSSYGANTLGADLQTSTTGNNSGVQKLGANYTFMAMYNGGIANEGYNHLASSFKNTKYIEYIYASNLTSDFYRGMALYETGSGTIPTYSTSTTTSIYRRNSYKSFYSITFSTTSAFRPVIWN